MMSETERPRHLEAYPRFNALEACKEVRLGRPICEYRNSRRMVGQLAVVALEPERVSIAYFVADKHIPSNEGQTGFNFDRPRFEQRDGYTRPYVRCPVCGKPHLVLCLVDQWACARCHKLLYRSQLIDPWARNDEKQRDLREQIGRGRPKGMHNTTFQALSKELAKLEKQHAKFHERRVKLNQKGAKLGKKVKLAIPTWPNEEHSIVLTNTWVPATYGYDLWLRDHVIRNGRVHAEASTG